MSDDATLSCLLSVADDSNTNLSGPQKELLLLHQRLGHADMQRIQHLCHAKGDDNTAHDILLMTHVTTKSCARPLSAACQMGKRGKTSAGNKSGQHSQRSGTLKRDHLQPGDRVSMDQYVSGVPGRQLETHGHEPPAKRLNGGTIFVDHASGFVWLHHQISLRVGETLQAKRSFEREAQSYGMRIKGYHADNMLFSFPEFKVDVHNKGQTIDYSGVGAHHQNAIAKCAIKTITGWARTMLLHSILHWPEQADLQLWPFAMLHAVYLWNHLPSRDNLLAPVELFSGTKFDNYNHLNRAHVWGAPVYVLDPSLQDGKKLPKWHPRTHRGMYVGVSWSHSTRVSMILNLKTGNMLTQFYVVHNDLFATVSSVDDKNSTSIVQSLDKDKWLKIVANGYKNALEDAEAGEVHPHWLELDEEWLTPSELAA
jgi:hypothetical protein